MSHLWRLSAAAGLLAALAGCVVDATPAQQPTPVVVSPAPVVTTPPTGTVVVQPQ
jgi:hypothetical protein